MRSLIASEALVAAAASAESAEEARPLVRGGTRAESKETTARRESKKGGPPAAPATLLALVNAVLGRAAAREEAVRCSWVRYTIRARARSGLTTGLAVFDRLLERSAICSEVGRAATRERDPHVTPDTQPVRCGDEDRSLRPFPLLQSQQAGAGAQDTRTHMDLLPPPSPTPLFNWSSWAIIDGGRGKLSATSF